MNPLTLVLTALATGAAAAAKDTAGQAIKDAYQGLKTLVQKKLGSTNAGGQVALEKHAEEPDVWAKPLEAELRKVGAAQDQDLVAAAHALMAEVDPKGAARGTYNTTVHGNVIGFVQGDHATVNIDTTKG